MWSWLPGEPSLPSGCAAVQLGANNTAHTDLTSMGRWLTRDCDSVLPAACLRVADDGLHEVDWVFAPAKTWALAGNACPPDFDFAPPRVCVLLTLLLRSFVSC